MQATSVPFNGRTLLIPLGMVVQVNTWKVHRDTRIWGDDAEQFVPER
jgi:cytochrome P450